MTIIKTAALAAATAILMSGDALAETALIHGEPGPNRGVRYDAVEQFVQQVQERTGGSLRIESHWGGALYKATAALPSVEDGVADLGTIIAAYFPTEMPELYLFDLPLGNADVWVGMQAAHELFSTDAQVKAQLDDKGLVYIAVFSTSAVQLGCKGAAVRSVADIKGKKIRWAGAYGNVFQTLGGNMVNMSAYDAFQGLETGLLDCSPTYPYFAEAAKQTELLDSLTLLDWGQIMGFGLFMNKAVFDGLTAQEQQALREAGTATIDFYAQRVNAANDAAIDKMRSGQTPRKIEVIAFSDAERAKLDAAAKSLIDDWKATARANGMDADAYFDKFQALTAKWKQIRDTQGYPWTRG